MFVIVESKIPEELLNFLLHHLANLTKGMTAVDEEEAVKKNIPGLIKKFDEENGTNYSNDSLNLHAIKNAVLKNFHGDRF